MNEKNENASCLTDEPLITADQVRRSLASSKHFLMMDLTTAPLTYIMRYSSYLRNFCSHSGKVSYCGNYEEA